MPKAKKTKQLRFDNVHDVLSTYGGVKEKIIEAANTGEIVFIDINTEEELVFDELPILGRNAKAQKGVTYKPENGFVVICQNFNYGFTTLERARQIMKNNYSAEGGHERVEFTQLAHSLGTYTSFVYGWNAIKDATAGCGGADGIVNPNRSPWLTHQQFLEICGKDDKNLDIKALMEARWRVPMVEAEVAAAVELEADMKEVFEAANIDQSTFDRRDYLSKMKSLMGSVHTGRKKDGKPHLNANTCVLEVNILTKKGDKTVENRRLIILEQFDLGTILKYLFAVKEQNNKFKFGLKYGDVSVMCREIAFQGNLQDRLNATTEMRSGFKNRIRRVQKVDV